MKIRIIGYAGSIKNLLTKEIQETYLIKGISLDDFFDIKDKKQRGKALNYQLNSLNSWIVEGTQVSNWTKSSIEDAELIVILDYQILTIHFGVLKQTVSQIVDPSYNLSQKKKIIRRMFKLFKWNQRFRQRLPNVKTSLPSHSCRLMILESPKDEKRLHQYIKGQLRRNQYSEKYIKK